MCSFARKYDAVGILNTDWGDFGHINHPDNSVPGIIYGAAFSWNQEEIPFEEINRQIARIEYKDLSEQFVNLLARIPGNCIFGWDKAVVYYETVELGDKQFDIQSGMEQVADGNAVIKANENLDKIKIQMKENAVHMDSSTRQKINSFLIVIEGIQTFNEIGITLIQGKQSFELASRLETWYMTYKELWRSTSKEGDLHHISEIVFWYADLLRSRERRRVKIY